MVPLPMKMIVLLLEYYVKYGKPSPWFFEGETKGEPSGERSLNLVFNHALTQAKIRKPAYAAFGCNPNLRLSPLNIWFIFGKENMDSRCDRTLLLL